MQLAKSLIFLNLFFCFQFTKASPICGALYSSEKAAGQISSAEDIVDLSKQIARATELNPLPLNAADFAAIEKLLTPINLRSDHIQRSIDKIIEILIDGNDTSAVQSPYNLAAGRVKNHTELTAGARNFRQLFSQKFQEQLDTAKYKISTSRWLLWKTKILSKYMFFFTLAGGWSAIESVQNENYYPLVGLAAGLVFSIKLPEKPLQSPLLESTIENGIRSNLVDLQQHSDSNKNRRLFARIKGAIAGAIFFSVMTTTSFDLTDRIFYGKNDQAVEQIRQKAKAERDAELDKQNQTTQSKIDEILARARKQEDELRK